ncbi:bifunctional phosphoribosylaminoimidazolecarboxamide formyltransferase/IMP cyclohydrolase [Candidatus Anaplasma sp. TIGMIC]|uniref:bifunctional phosphoribosylaminoimidazolecarboxamide formyltransferase/IMP cyclohydrolase n=1 Tax=Candidatus Anaplasma sp. TIGMIC TaxID=3020713 RepID=UPI00232FDC85|nr:bifunctional phosphoribosylaminoimidazolecarboxamide formyltransferase/IMP cyclohydrolase [Candidatus Anaplasma sp. TIGMIC]MDB1135311.1 bifunctional phosphoribosylaminoimidazolecarboxamide formyltransferase/IMP cyclohydrolase [Candidatus Anaplasma sp. TIGMIC]
MVSNNTGTKVALLSVTDKKRIVEVARFLVGNGYSILATKNTHKLLMDAKVASVEVSDYTGHDEIMDGRVKTLHPKIFAGILSNRTSHAKEAQKWNIDEIDIVVVNLYPFSEFCKRSAAKEQDIVEQIDIGGVALMRAGAKNYAHVTVVPGVQDYDSLFEEITNNSGVTTIEYRKKMAARAFALTASYDAQIHGWLSVDTELFPDRIVLCGSKVQDLRIGENPHQQAALYNIGHRPMPIEQLHGKALSYNNIVDIEASMKIVAEFSMPAVSVIKHSNPCGAAISDDIGCAYDKAISCDLRSSFGGIIAFNRNMTIDIARKIMGIFVEAVVAPGFDDGVIETLTAKKNLRIIKSIPYEGTQLIYKSTLCSSLLVQERDSVAVEIGDFDLVTEAAATPEALEDLMFAWKVCKHVKSNAVVIARDGRAIGVGAGQMSRVDSVEIAIRKAGNCANAVLSSDAFFPFADSIQHAVSAGISAIVQPGGSVRDKEVIEAANLSSVPMYFTGLRSFCH